MSDGTPGEGLQDWAKVEQLEAQVLRLKLERNQQDAELEQLRAAAQHVLMCRASGNYGPDGRMGLRLLEKAVASKTAAAEAERWTHPELTAVKYERDDGTIVLTKTRTKAMVLGGHTAVIWLQGVPGCVLLSRVTLVGGGA